MAPRSTITTTRACVGAERALLAALQAGCTAPVGTLAEVVEGEHGTELSLRAFVGSKGADIVLRRSSVGPLVDPERLGRELAAVLLADGAADLIDSGDPPPQASPVVDSREPETVQFDASHPDRSPSERAL